MIRLIRLFVALVFACAVTATHAESEKKPTFSKGDRFQYELYWSLIKVGSAELRFVEGRLNESGPKLQHIIFTARTTGIADKIFKVRDRIEVWIDPSNSRPLLYLKEQREGKTNRDVRVSFDWEQMTATYSNKGVAKDPIIISEDTLDPLSILAALASQPFSDGECRTQNATDGKRVVQIEATQTKQVRCKVPAGRFQANRIDVATKELRGVFEKSPDASIHLWLGTEIPAIPLKMKSEVAVGSFHGHLTGAQIGDQVIGKLKEFD